MPTIRYTKTFFKQPSRINEDTYDTLKRELIKNPNFEIDPNPETFSQHFKGSLKTIKVCGIIIIISLVLSLGFSDHAGDFFDKLAIPGGICIFIIIFTAIPLLLMEGPSYATYVKKKTEYFSRMKYGIQNTGSYREFCLSFYGK